MKSKIITAVGLLLLFYRGVSAQKIDTLTNAKRQFTTAEDVLGLPAIYTVLKCGIRIDSKTNGLLAVFYAKDGSRYCVNTNSTDFGKLWQRMMSMAITGDKIIIDEIIVKKADKEMKWMTKTFVVP